MLSRIARGAILPFKGGNFTISRLSLTLKDEELCRFSFLIIDGPFAYCLSFTAWLGGWGTGWDFGFAYTRKKTHRKINQSTPIPVNNIVILVWFTEATKGFLESNTKFPSYLVTDSVSIFFIRLLSISPTFGSLIHLTREIKRERVWSNNRSVIIAKLCSQPCWMH